MKDEIAKLARAEATGIITADVAARAWATDRNAASRRLAALARGGWLRRLQRGTYEVAALESSSDVPASYEDPWALAGVLFAPCYIGGWSAAEHWGLTEQLFRETFVITAAHVRTTRTVVGGAAFRLARVTPEKARGDSSVWRRTTRVACSSPERTLVDGANIPSWVGGVRHLTDILARYVELPSRNLEALGTALKEVGRGAAAKRLGFIAEELAVGERDAEAHAALLAVRDMALSFRTSGVVRLDPAVSRHGPMNTHWGLWVNVRVAREAHS
ncbi:MAG: type IV toxin-antitoxin system AbiEi family antitoxin [bacterium]